MIWLGKPELKSHKETQQKIYVGDGILEQIKKFYHYRKFDLETIIQVSRQIRTI